MASEWFFDFEDDAYRRFWLPKCLEPVDGEPSTLASRDVYHHYLAFCAELGIEHPYSLATVRNAVRDHYRIDNIRTGLRAYRLVDLTTDLDQDQLRRDLRAQSRREFTEYEDRARLQCPWCDVRYYDGNRFTHCYWCQRILTDGIDAALDDYLAQDSGRTGTSMRLAYRRLIATGLIDDPDPQYADSPSGALDQDGQPHVLPPRPTGLVGARAPRVQWGRKTKIACSILAGMFLGAILLLMGLCVIAVSTS